MNTAPRSTISGQAPLTTESRGCPHSSLNSSILRGPGLPRDRTRVGVAGNRSHGRPLHPGERGALGFPRARIAIERISSYPMSVSNDRRRQLTEEIHNRRTGKGAGFLRLKRKWSGLVRSSRSRVFRRCFRRYAVSGTRELRKCNGCVEIASVEHDFAVDPIEIFRFFLDSCSLSLNRHSLVSGFDRS